MKKLTISAFLFALSGFGFLLLAIRYTFLKSLIAGLPFFFATVGLFILSYLTLIRHK